MKVETPYILWHYFNNKPVPVVTVDTHPSGRLATAGCDGVIRIWKLRHDGTPTPHSKQGPPTLASNGTDSQPPLHVDFLSEFSESDANVNTIRFSPNGHILAVVTDSKHVTLYRYAGPVNPHDNPTQFGTDLGTYNVEVWKRCSSRVNGTDEVISIAWMQDSLSFYTSSLHGAITTWSVNDRDKGTIPSLMNVCMKMSLGMQDPVEIFPTLQGSSPMDKTSDDQSNGDTNNRLTNHDINKHIDKTLPPKQVGLSLSDVDKLVNHFHAVMIDRVYQLEWQQYVTEHRKKLSSLADAHLPLTTGTPNYNQPTDANMSTPSDTTPPTDSNTVTPQQPPVPPFRSILSSLTTLPNPLGLALYSLPYDEYCLFTHTPTCSFDGTVTGGAIGDAYSFTPLPQQDQRQQHKYGAFGSIIPLPTPYIDPNSQDLPAPPPNPMLPHPLHQFSLRKTSLIDPYKQSDRDNSNGIHTHPSKRSSLPIQFLPLSQRTYVTRIESIKEVPITGAEKTMMDDEDGAGVPFNTNPGDQASTATTDTSATSSTIPASTSTAATTTTTSTSTNTASFLFSVDSDDEDGTSITPAASTSTTTTTTTTVSHPKKPIQTKPIIQFTTAAPIAAPLEGIQNLCLSFSRHPLTFHLNSSHAQGIICDPLGLFVVALFADREMVVFKPTAPSQADIIARQSASAKKAAAAAALANDAGASQKKEYEQIQPALPPGMPSSYPSGGMNNNNNDGTASSTKPSSIPPLEVVDRLQKYPISDPVLVEAGITDCFLFFKETKPLFFRRPDWSPDGAFLAAPCGLCYAKKPTGIINPLDVVDEGEHSEMADHQQHDDHTPNSCSSDPAPSPSDNSTSTTTTATTHDQKLSQLGYSEENCTHIFHRNNLTTPFISLPSTEETIAVRFSPHPFISPANNQIAKDIIAEYNDYIKLPASERDAFPCTIPINCTASTTAYYYLLAVASLNRVVIYRTDTFQPIAFATGLHFEPITDIAWMNDGYTLLVTSRDGYCSFVRFDPAELDPLLSGHLLHVYRKTIQSYQQRVSHAKLHNELLAYNKGVDVVTEAYIQLQSYLHHIIESTWSLPEHAPILRQWLFGTLQMYVTVTPIDQPTPAQLATLSTLSLSSSSSTAASLYATSDINTHQLTHKPATKRKTIATTQGTEHVTKTAPKTPKKEKKEKEHAVSDEAAFKYLTDYHNEHGKWPTKTQFRKDLKIGPTRTNQLYAAHGADTRPTPSRTIVTPSGTRRSSRLRRRYGDDDNDDDDDDRSDNDGASDENDENDSDNIDDNDGDREDTPTHHHDPNAVNDANTTTSSPSSPNTLPPLNRVLDFTEDQSDSVENVEINTISSSVSTKDASNTLSAVFPHQQVSELGVSTSGKPQGDSPVGDNDNCNDAGTDNIEHVAKRPRTSY